MKNMLETLQDVLLVFTVILLVYVLYKRLLLILGKEKINKIYPITGEKIFWEDRQASLEILLEEQTHLTLTIFDQNNAKVEEVLSRDFESGKHALRADCRNLPAGRYYFKIKSPNHESSQYFEMA